MIKQDYKPVEECKTVAELLADPKRWCQGDYAVDAKGRNTDTTSRNGIAWCPVGAACRLLGNTGKSVDHIDEINQIQALLDEYVPDHRNIYAWNDDPARTHEEVLEVVTKASI